jgi:predicted transcriptional regulator
MEPTRPGAARPAAQQGKECIMIRQDQHRAIATSALFARKGEAMPVGGRRTPRRVIAMRPLVAEHEAPIALPRPANTSMPAPFERHGEAAPGNVVPFIAPTMGPAVGDAMIHNAPQAKAAPRAAKTQPRLMTGTAIRSPLRSGPATSRRTSATKRTTLRLDEAMRARLAHFSTSETLSVQALLTRALQRHLPAISVERPTVASLRLPRDARKPTLSGRRSVRFDAHLYWRLKTAATKRRRSMQSIMTAALEAYLAELEAGGQAHRHQASLAAHLSVVA